MELIKERRRTRKVKWVVDITGNAGKSIYTDILECIPGMRVLRITLDYYRSFKYQTAKMISEYKKSKGVPDVILIDAPRDEESKYLHQVYAALEEINNGRLEGSFGGKTIKDKMPRNIPIIVFSNAPPIIGALSTDRWQIMALYEYLGTEEKPDIFVQKAMVSSYIEDYAGGQIYWRNFTKTIVNPDIGDEHESDRILLDMQIKNIKLTEKQIQAEEQITKMPSKNKPGQITGWSPIDVSTFSNAPKYVKIKAKELIKKIKNNS